MRSQTTEQKGQFAVLRVQLEAGKKGALVFLPTTQARCDMVLEYQSKLYRVQVKYGNGKALHADGVVRLDLRRRNRCYTRGEIDVLVVYVPQTDSLYWFGPDVFENKIALYLRLLPSKNGQKNGCLMAEEYRW